MRELKLYLETSVWNFVFADDAPEKQEITRKFFDNLASSPYLIYASETVFLEFEAATEDKQQELLEVISRHDPTILNLTPEVTKLADKYIEHGALPRKARNDALHVAYSSVHELDLVVSWNLRHIANIHRQERVQGVNLLNGYTKPILLITPMEVSEHDRRED
jgi:predicted nucleic acid-binding protein